MEIATLEQQRAGFAKGTSGNPKGRAAIRERAAKLYDIMAGDFGELSAVDQVLLNQACLLLARSERVHRVRDIDVGVRMSGEARRLLQVLRRRVPDRSAPAETFTDIAARAQAEASQRRARELAEDDAATEGAAENAPTSGHARAEATAADSDVGITSS